MASSSAEDSNAFRQKFSGYDARDNSGASETRRSGCDLPDRIGFALIRVEEIMLNYLYEQ